MKDTYFVPFARFSVLFSWAHTHTHTHKEMFCSSKLSWGLQEIKESPAATHTITIALHHFLYRAVYYQCSRWGEQSQVHSTLGSKNPKGRFCRWSKICLPETCLFGMKINLGWSFLPTEDSGCLSFYLPLRCPENLDKGSVPRIELSSEISAKVMG